MPKKTAIQEGIQAGIKHALILIQQRQAIDMELADLGIDEKTIASLGNKSLMHEAIVAGAEMGKTFKALKAKAPKAPKADGKAYAPRKDSHAEKALEHLKGGEKSYQDIAKHLKIEQLTPVMKPLVKHKLVSERKEGRNKFYKLA